MKTLQQQKGQYGEHLAIEFLQKKGYTILETNYKYKRGEIDIIAQTSHQMIFVEVKLRSSDNFGLPEETVSEHQQELIIQTAEQYLEDNNWQGDIRFDIIAIQARVNLPNEITHFEDAFY